MKKIKGGELSLTHRFLGFKQDSLLMVNALAAFPFDAPESPLPEDAVWEALKKACGRNIFDEGILKTRAEFLVHGACFAPGGVPVQACPVRIRVGDREKRLVVFGDRIWSGRGVLPRISDPVPFARMDLSWTNAFGGAGFKRNPLGKGASETGLPGGETVLPLPNVEYPDRLVAAPEDRPPPACPDMLGSLRFWRGEGFGTYDERWLVEHWPHNAPDVNLDLGNNASPDQWAEGYYSGGEPVEIEHMHPEQPLLRTRLPRLRLRMFARRFLRERIHFEELTTHFDTAWLLPEDRLMVCVWRAMILASVHAAKDVTHLTAGFEPLDAEPLPREAYYRRMGMEDVQGPPPPAPEPPAAESAPSVPPEAAAPEPPAPAPPIPVPGLDQEVEQARAALQAAMKRLGLEQPPPLPDPGQPFGLDGLSPSQALAALDGMLAEAKKGLDALAAQAGLDLSAFQPPALPTLAEMTAALSALDVRDPRLKAAVEDLKGLIRDIPPEPAGPTQAPPEPEPLQAPPPPRPASSRLTREDVAQYAASGRSLSGLDLTGLDLSGCLLAGADVSEAMLEGADLSGADLSGADLSGAVLSGADLSGAKASRAVLAGVLGQGMKGAGADFTGADLSGAGLSGTDLAKANLSGADLSGADLEEAVLSGAGLSGCRAARARFSGAKADQAVFSGAALAGADFTSADLSEADFRQADLRSATFHEASGAGASFAAADLTGSKAPSGASFAGADFSGAGFAGAVWTESDLQGARFGRAVLDGASFRGSLLCGADFALASAKSLVLDEADLSGANMSGVNAFKASLRGAVLHKADLRDSNFYCVDFHRARFHETLLSGANLARTILAKWRAIRL